MFEKIRGFFYEENVKLIVEAYNHLPSFKRQNFVVEVLPFTLANLQEMNENDVLLLDVDFPQDTVAFVSRIEKVDFEERNNGFYYLNLQSMFWIGSIYGYEGRVTQRLYKYSGGGSFLLAGYNDNGELVSYRNNSEDEYQNRFILKMRGGEKRLFDSSIVSEKAKNFFKTTNFDLVSY